MLKRKTFRHTLGLALSGGGTRGFAHLGVFRAFEQCHVPVSCVAGTSAGSIMGAFLCAVYLTRYLRVRQRQSPKRI